MASSLWTCAEAQISGASFQSMQRMCTSGERMSMASSLWACAEVEKLGPQTLEWFILECVQRCCVLGETNKRAVAAQT